MRRRHFFPAILLGAAGLLSMVADSVNVPVQTHDYLNALVVDENYALGTRWLEADIPHEEKLSAVDQATFIHILEKYDTQSSLMGARKLFLDQAETVAESRHCQVDNCQYSTYLNRTVKPNYIHGDLRLVQMNETSIRQPVSVTGENVSFGAKFLETRQIRYMLTERGWVLKSVEISDQNAYAPPKATAFDTEKISGLNYYPKTAAWDEFWEKFPVEEILRDLDAVSDLGANAVRIFLQHENFANLETQEDGLAKLETFLNFCEDRNIKVIVATFDLRADYRLQNWSRDSAHIATILNSIHDHPALLAVDLKNQPDLDFKNAGEGTVTAWLAAMIASVRQSYPDLPLTIGWSDPSQAAKLADQLNLVSFHDYNNPKGLASRLKTLKEQVGDKPVFATEIGHSRWSLLGDRPSRQAERLTQQLTQLSEANGVFVWTLHDFDEIGSNIVGHRPWRKAQQKAYGITTDEDTWRPAAQAFHAFNQTFHSTPRGD